MRDTRTAIPTNVRAASPCCGIWVYPADAVRIIPTDPPRVAYQCRGCEAEIEQPATAEDVTAILTCRAALQAARAAG